MSYASPTSGAIDSNYDSCEGSGSEIVCDVKQKIVIFVSVSLGVGMVITILYCIFKGEIPSLCFRYLQVLTWGLFQPWLSISLCFFLDVIPFCVW